MASSFARAWLIDGELAGLGGVVGQTLSSSGYVWLALSENAKKYPIAVIKEARRQIAGLMETKTRLTAKLLPNDRDARKFALLLGFRPSGDDGIEYRRAWPEAKAPFIVFSLPRSRSKWMSVLLSNGAECSHDLPVNVETVDELCEAIARGGSVETGLAPAWRVLRERFPDIRFAVIRRPIYQVMESAAKCGWVYEEAYLRKQAEILDEISSLPGTLTVGIDELQAFEDCARIYEHCIGELLDRSVWERLSTQNIQIDMAERMHLLQAKQAKMLKLFTDLGKIVTVQQECFDTFYRDAQSLFAAHYEEAGSFDGLPLDPNIDMAQEMERAGRLLVMTARCGGVIVGYIVFLINPSFESKNVLLGFQNIFYVKPEFRGKLGKRIRDSAIARLKEMGVKMLILRSGVRARGPHLAAMFEREGALHLGGLYSLALEG